jgi:CRP-like cAMP-binding protein
MSHNYTAALKAAAICRTLAPVELEAIAAIAEPLTIAAGKDLFREGDAGDGLYLVLAGEIDVLKRAPGGGDRSLARFGPGGVLGEMSLLTDEARSATGRALVETTVLRLPAARFRGLLDANSSAALKIVGGIAQLLAQRVATMNAKIVELIDQGESGVKKAAALKEKELIELHRALQVWSF